MNRPKIPINTKRELFIEAGFRCSINKCNHESGLEIHHIDSNPQNNDIQNLLLVCGTHHNNIHSGLIDKKTCKILKNNLRESIGDNLFQTTKHLPNRRKYKEYVADLLSKNPIELKAMIIGPLFLHPEWFINKRIQKLRGVSFTKHLIDYLNFNVKKPNSDIRIIVRNSIRYSSAIRPLISSNEELMLLKRAMYSNLESLSKMLHQYNSFSFACFDPGYYQGIIISENECCKYHRNEEDTQINGGYIFYDPQTLEFENNRFDEIFDSNFRGIDKELEELEKFIKRLRI